ncbi:heavy-metal-associated domain-containing protein [candidate division KSB1 bacterium]|nr:heavy-metal-associated domain-containing protein [candidate division KSB1 bacterium]
MKSVTLNVEGMSCDHCMHSIEGALKSIGVIGKVALEKKTVQVDFDENRITLEAVKEAINNQGYQVQ